MNIPTPSRLLLGLLGCALLVLLPGCDSPQKTADTLRRDIAAFPAAPDAEASRKIEENLSRLQVQIDKLRSAGKDAEANGWQQELTSLQIQYAGARVGAGLQKAKQAADGIGEAFRQAGQSIGEAFGGKSNGD